MSKPKVFKPIERLFANIALRFIPIIFFKEVTLVIIN